MKVHKESPGLHKALPPCQNQNLTFSLTRFLNPDSEAPKDASVLSKPFHLKDLVNEGERLLAA